MSRPPSTPYIPPPASYASPAPQGVNPALPYHQTPGAAASWQSPAPRGKVPAPVPARGRGRPTNASYAQAAPYPAPAFQAPPPPPPPVPPRAVLPTTPQAWQTTYASRLRTGTSLLMQPIIAPAATAGAGATATGRRRGAVNYAEAGSGDELDAGAIDSDDSDFIASGGTRAGVRRTGGAGAPRPSIPGQPPHPGHPQKAELDRSYLGQVPPARFIAPKPMHGMRPEYIPQAALDAAAEKPAALVPIRVEIDTDTHRIRDCFVWNANEDLITPQSFARIFCADLDLPQHPYVEQVANAIRAQLEEHSVVATMDLLSEAKDDHVDDDEDRPDECRVILQIDVQISTLHLLDHVEWDLLSPLTPEMFSQTLCADLCLPPDSVPLIAHAVHEELLRHKRDVIEWGVMHAGESKRSELHGGIPGGWGKKGRAGRRLKSVWRDWHEVVNGDFAPRLEEMTVEELERREAERERASRRLRRETSKFQATGLSRRRHRDRGER